MSSIGSLECYLQDHIALYKLVAVLITNGESSNKYSLIFCIFSYLRYVESSFLCPTNIDSLHNVLLYTDFGG